MGIESENYSYVFKSATISQANTYQQFEKDFLSSLDADCNLFISNIFTLQALKNEKIDLDQCFVPARIDHISQMRRSQTSNCHFYVRFWTENCLKEIKWKEKYQN